MCHCDRTLVWGQADNQSENYHTCIPHFMFCSKSVCNWGNPERAPHKWYNITRTGICMYVCMIHPSSLHYCHAMTLTWTDHESDTCSLTIHTHDFVSTALIDQLNEPIRQDEFFNRPERTKDPKEMIARESNGKSA